jgi:hypothetical protein
MMRIEIRIDRVVLDKHSAARRGEREIRAALETELATLLAATPRSAWTQSRTVAAVRGVWLPSARQDIGDATARALHRAIVDGRPPRSGHSHE